MTLVKTLYSEFESQAVTSVVSGFMFASAISWMDLIRFLLARYVKVQANGAKHFLLTALATTLIAVSVLVAVRMAMPKKDIKPVKPVYAVS